MSEKPTMSSEGRLSNEVWVSGTTNVPDSQSSLESRPFEGEGGGTIEVKERSNDEVAAMLRKLEEKVTTLEGVITVKDAEIAELSKKVVSMVEPLPLNDDHEFKMACAGLEQPMDVNMFGSGDMDMERAGGLMPMKTEDFAIDASGSNLRELSFFKDFVVNEWDELKQVGEGLPLRESVRAFIEHLRREFKFPDKTYERMTFMLNNNSDNIRPDDEVVKMLVLCTIVVPRKLKNESNEEGKKYKTSSTTIQQDK